MANAAVLDHFSALKDPRQAWKVRPDHCLGRSRGGLTTKIHVVVDVQALPIRIGLTAGQAHDGQIADRLLDRLAPRIIVLADKAHDADRIRALIEEQGATPNIAAKRNRNWKPCWLIAADASGYPMADVLLALIDYNSAVESAPESVRFANNLRANELNERWAKPDRAIPAGLFDGSENENPTQATCGGP